MCLYRERELNTEEWEGKMILKPEVHLKNAKQSYYSLIEEDAILWLRENGIHVNSDDIEFVYGTPEYFSSSGYTQGYYMEYSTKTWNKVQEKELSDAGLQVLREEGQLKWPNIWYAVRLKNIDEILPLETGAIEEAIASGGVPQKYRVKHS